MADKNQSKVLTELTLHEGRGNGITAHDLAGRLEISERDVRHAVSSLRLEGIAVCGAPRDGYFIAATPEELEHTCNFLRSRAMHSLTLESKLRHIPLVELLGQMRLDT